MDAKVRERKATYCNLTVGLLVLLLSASSVFSAFGGQFEDAVGAYERGNYTIAYRLFKELAEKGTPEAQFNLGVMYDTGQGVLQDYVEAAMWYQRAANQGYAAAQFNLGIRYAKGQGVPEDYVLAHMWINLAASRFPPSEQGNREMAVKSRDIVASMMTPDQIAEAQRMVREWKPKMEGK